MNLRLKIAELRVALPDALRISDKQRKRPDHPGLTFICAFAILVLVSFGMLYLGDKLNASGMVLTRFMATGQAAVTARIGYPDAARDQIAVVLYDEQFLREYGGVWPLSYQEHADWLLRLAGQPGSHPTAIFLDITFGQARDDPSLPALKEALCTLRDTLRIPVFLAALPDAATGRLAVREGLGTCFTLVGVDYVPDPLDGYAWTYPLTTHLGEAIYRSAALALAQDAGGIVLGDESAPMALVWGAQAPHGAPPAERDQGCIPERSWQRTLTPGLFFQFSAPLPPLCPYHRTVSMEQVGAMSDADLAEALAGRYVMVGANIPGHNDFARSPVHGLLPGVHYHAMALDNLLSYGARYKLDLEWNPEGIATLAVPGLLTVLAVLAVHWVWSWGLASSWWKNIAGRLTSAGVVRAWSDEATRRGRTGLALAGALAWAARLALQFVSAALLIALLQMTFRAGMLPVVELIGMTLFVEAIDYVAHLRWYFLGEEAHEPASESRQPDPHPTPL